ncbi:MAG: DsbA family protein [Nanoarchaeota archaeon]|nr:DsbA family protein [Nanoarchaeota archaeon]
MVKTKVRKVNSDEVSPKDYSSRDNESNSSNSNVLLLTIIGLLAVVIILLIVVLLTMSSHQTTSEGSQLNEINEKVTRLDNFFKNNIPEYEAGTPQELTPDNFPTVQRPSLENRPVKGNLDASITLVEYSDFGCPFCERFFSQTYPQLMRYVDDGTANFVYKHFPVVGGENPALASACVYLEEGTDMFYEFHDKIFEEHANNRAGITSLSNLKNWAVELGANEANYDDCMASPRAQELVQQDFQEAQSVGVTGTPSVVINDKLIVGACPISTFEQAIQLELAGTPFYVNECQIITA